MLANEQTLNSLLGLASRVMENDKCIFLLRYNLQGSDFEKEVDFSKSFSCLAEVTRNCGFEALEKEFKNCKFDASASYETGFITFKTNDNAIVFTFAFIYNEFKKQYENQLRISGKVETSIPAGDIGLLVYLQSLKI